MMKPRDLSGELWRVYDFQYDGPGRIYRIEEPRLLWVGETTHRVLDAKGIMHLVPAPGHLGCVVQWKPRNAEEPVQF